MKFHDFTLEFAPGPAGGLSVKVADSPARQGGYEPFEPPAVEEDLEIIARAAEARADAERSGEERGDLGNLEKLSATALHSLGARLFEHLFRGSVRRRFEMSLSGLGPEDGLRIKIRLDLNEPALVPLLSLPWELLFEGENSRSFGLDQRFSIVRFLPQRRVLDRRELPRPLRILLATAEPRSSRLLSLDDEVGRICQAVTRPGEIEVENLTHTTLESLRRALAETEFHVLHFMGHGDFDSKTGEGELHFEDGRRGLSKVPGQMLADVLRGRASLRLIFLNACRTARTAAEKPFAGVATALVQAGVPAVLAMQFPIADSAAVVFSEAVYRRLAAGDPIDAAVAEGRKAMFVKMPELLAWGTPVLFSHVPDGRLFGRGDFFQARKPTVLPFPSLGPLFHGRNEMLWLLYDRLAQAPPGRATAIAGKAVHGLGGVGKTRLAVEYAWRYAEDYSALLFVGAGSPADLRRNLAAFCAQEVLDLPEREEKEEEIREAAVVRWLGENSRWLLILDNVDSEEAATAVDGLVSRLHGGYVLLTGRLARWGVDVEALELDLLTEEASVAFLLARTEGKRRPTKDDEVHAAKIAQELGFLPLALEQAGAYVSERRLTLAGYLEEWQSKRSAVLAWFDPRVSRYPASVAVTWQTSVDRLSAPALVLLQLLALFGPEPIPETLLDLLAPMVKDNPFDSLAELSTYSLVNRAADVPTFNVHLLVQEVTRNSQRGVESETLQVALLWVQAAAEADPQDVRSWPKLEPLASHIQALVAFAEAAGVPQLTAILVNQLALLYFAKALHSEAEPLMRKVLALDELSFGPDHPRVAGDLNNLAQLLETTNRLAEAEPLMRRALTIDENNFEPGHPDVARDLSNLAKLLIATNRLAEAELLILEVVRVVEGNPGQNRTNLSIYLNNLAQLFSATNRFTEAESLMRRVLEIDQGSYGPDHPNVAIDLNNLSALLYSTNRFAEAEPLMRRALEIKERCLGPDHPDVAVGLNNLAQLLEATNGFAEAEPLMHRSLAISERSFGPAHPTVATDLNNLAALLLATNRSTEAEALFLRALSINEESFGPNHPKVATDLNNLAQLFLETNRLTEAEPLFCRALQIDEEAFGPNHPEVATDLNNLALLFQEANRLDEAEPLIRRALAIDEKSFGADHPKIALRLNNLAQLLQATNRFSEAEPPMRRALSIDEGSLGPNHPDVARDLNNMALLLKGTNRLAEAEPLIRRALAIDERSFGPDHPVVARDLGNLAVMLQKANRNAEAFLLMARALEIDENSYGTNHPNVAVRLNNLAALLKETSCFAEAEPLMRWALKIDEASFGGNHPRIATRLNNLAQLLKATNRTAEAEPLMRRALEIDEKSLGRDHPHVAIRLNNLAALLKDTNRFAEAEPLMLRNVEILLDFTRKAGLEHLHLQTALANYAGLLQAMGKSPAEAKAVIEVLVESSEGNHFAIENS